MHVDIHEIQPGWDVRDMDGAPLGTVKSVSPNHVQVKSEGILSKDYFVPHSAIATVEERWVELDVRKSDLAARRWDLPPTEPDRRRAGVPGRIRTCDLPLRRRAGLWSLG